jgi:penicillin-binding protein 1A
MYMVDQVMAGATDLYAQQNKLADAYWKRPTGIQVINGDLYPSYFNKASIPANTPMVFDKVSKRKATDCTPDLAKETINVLKTTDPVTKQDVISSPDGYDATADDNAHSCSDAKPSVSVSVAGNSATVTYTAGTFSPTNVALLIDGQQTAAQSISASGTWTVALSASAGLHSVTAVVTDSGYYQTTSASAAYNAH